MTLLERFLKYIAIDTTSNSKSKTTPSTKIQLNLAKELLLELDYLGLKTFYDSENGYIYALLKGDSSCPKIGFISHLDTSEEAKGNNIKPQIIYDYNGLDVKLNSDKILRVKDYPDLLNHKGKTLITTSGDTLLGADDKAGIAEIMNMLEYFVNTRHHHGDIYVAFTPDEEIGKSIDKFDLSKFPAHFGYTVDGSSLGEVCYENFNAASITIEIEGISCHYGYAKDKLVNSLYIATLINNSLPPERPETTEGYTGYYHLEEVNGNVNNTIMHYIIRDFNQENFENRKSTFRKIIKVLEEKFSIKIKLTIKDSYQNMKEALKENMHLIDNAKEVIESMNIKPISRPIRGGTDGAQLSHKGFACPNLGTGGHNFHSIYEYAVLEDMEKSSEILIGIVKRYAKRNSKEFVRTPKK